MEAAAALRLETIASEANEKVEEEEGENLIRNAFPIVISFSLNCTSRRNALKIFVRFIVGGNYGEMEMATAARFSSSRREFFRLLFRRAG
jgi:hypothetical protein